MGISAIVSTCFRASEWVVWYGSEYTTLFGNVFEGLIRPDDAAEKFLYSITIDAGEKKEYYKNLV